MRINDPYWMPCYLNPTFDELIELADSIWDSVRILVIDDPRCKFNDGIVLASGYGNTHETLARNLKYFLGLKRAPWSIPYILYKRLGSFLFNLGDVSGPDNASMEEGLREFSSEHQQILTDLIELSRSVNEKLAKYQEVE